MTREHSSAPPRAWQRMLSGRRLDLLDPSPLDVEIADIAHGLARVARWNGQTVGEHAFSVAEHSLLVTEIVCALAPDCSPQWQLAALLHDAPEYVVGDLISPFKTAIGDDYKDIENRLLRAIHIRFGLPPDLPRHVSAMIKRADRVSAYFEATTLAGFEPREATHFFGAPPELPLPLGSRLRGLTPLPAVMAQSAYLEKFHGLLDCSGKQSVKPGAD